MGYEMVKSLFFNVTLMISLLYIMSRIRPNYAVSGNKLVDTLYIVLCAAVLSVLCMVFPVYSGPDFQYDLRGIPIVLLGMMSGITPALAAAVILTPYRIFIGGGALVSGIVSGMFIPVVIGGAFYWICKFINSDMSAESKLDVWNLALLGIIMWVKDKITFEYFIPGGHAFLSHMELVILFSDILAFIVMGLIIKDNISFSRSNFEFREKAFTDELTRLKNYRYIISVVYKFPEEARKRLERFCVLMLDIDNFKKYNDTYGHLEGDRVLKTISGILMDSVRNSDVVARYGGEEFLIVLNSTDMEGAYQIAERIRKNAEETVYSNNNFSTKRNVTISIGISEFPVHGTNMRDLIDKADTALYAAKKKGKNNVQIYHLDATQESSGK